MPHKLQDQMPAPEDMARHIAIDVGARALAKAVADRIGSNLIMQRYSRLVIDMNRPQDSAELCPEISDETKIPFNHGLTEIEKSERINAIFDPYHNTIASTLDDKNHSYQALVAIHSFTPALRNRPPRPWHADLISRTSIDVVRTLQDILQTKRPELNFGVNAIFAVSDQSDYTLRAHAERRGLLGLSIEIRNDLLATDTQINEWGELLTQGLSAAFANQIPNLSCGAH